MNVFSLPHAFPMLYKKLDVYIPSEEEQSHSLSSYLQEIKEKICMYDSWEIFKEYTNPYEYIHTKTPHKKSVASYQPLSRSYFKMIEILKQFSLLYPYRNQSIRTFHLAEGPGGFVEAVLNMRKSQVPISIYHKDSYHAITLIQENNKSVPSWRRSHFFIRNNPNVHIELGSDLTGNLLHMENFVDMVTKYGSQMDLITADGGFDFSEDFNRQEICILPLLVAQICYALSLQKAEGCFVLKIFDCFLPATIDLLYLLSSCYENVYLTKPLTSRVANSEKYIVCENYHHENYHDIYAHLFGWFKTILEIKPENWKSSLRMLNVKIPRFFTSKLDEYCLILGHQQINNIFSTLSLIHNKNNRNGKIEYLIKIHISKCLCWCLKHNIAVDKFFTNHLV